MLKQYLILILYTIEIILCKFFVICILVCRQYTNYCKVDIISKVLTSLVWCSLIGWNRGMTLSCCSNFCISCWNTSLSCSLSMACSWSLIIIIVTEEIIFIETIISLYLYLFCLKTNNWCPQNTPNQKV